MCVSLRHGVVIVPCERDMTLEQYSLADGALVRTVGGPGDGPGAFDFGWGGVCITHRDTVLVAETPNRRVQEVRVVDGGHVRFVGDSVLALPITVDCNDAVVVVSEGVNQVCVSPPTPPPVFG